jgi:hypothetical protein
MLLAAVLGVAAGGCYVGVLVGDPNGESAIQITGQPQSRMVHPGEAATFTVDVTGAPPISYQWHRNGVDIAGAANFTYTTPPTTLTDDGTQFTVRACNWWACQTSSPALLSVVR